MTLPSFIAERPQTRPKELVSALKSRETGEDSFEKTLERVNRESSDSQKRTEKVVQESSPSKDTVAKEAVVPEGEGVEKKKPSRSKKDPESRPEVGGKEEKASRLPRQCENDPADRVKDTLRLNKGSYKKNSNKKIDTQEIRQEKDSGKDEDGSSAASLLSSGVLNAGVINHEAASKSDKIDTDRKVLVKTESSDGADRGDGAGAFHGVDDASDSSEKKPRLRVLDFRTEMEKAGKEGKNFESDVEVKGETKREIRMDVSEAVSRESAAKNSASDEIVKTIQIQTDLSSGEVAETLSSRTPAASQMRQSLQDRFQETLGPKLVKEASILLKDQASGEIRLIMKPEQLGKVKIRLSLDDNHIAGRIFVENSNVKELLDSTIEQLTRSFTEKGYEISQLDVQVGDRRSASDSGLGGRRRRTAAAAAAAELLESSVPDVARTEYEAAVVNLMA